MKLLAVKDRVYDLLLSDAKYRNNDSKLVVAVWKQEYLGPGQKLTKNTPLDDFFLAYEFGRLTPADTITRCRRKLQETIPALRGTLWNKRHEIQEDVINQLKAF